MIFEKIVCDRCKKEMNHPEGRKIWLSGVGREGGYDLCPECYYDLYHWFFEPKGKRRGERVSGQGSTVMTVRRVGNEHE